MKISLKSAVVLATAVVLSQVGAQVNAAEVPVAGAKASGNRATPVVIARKVPFTAQDVAKYRRLEAGSRSLRAAGADDAESWLIIGVAAVAITGVVWYGHLYHNTGGGMGGGGY